MLVPSLDLYSPRVNMHSEGIIKESEILPGSAFVCPVYIPQPVSLSFHPSYQVTCTPPDQEDELFPSIQVISYSEDFICCVTYLENRSTLIVLIFFAMALNVGIPVGWKAVESAGAQPFQPKGIFRNGQ